MDRSVADLYADRWFPKQAEKALQARDYQQSQQWSKHVKKESIRQLEKFNILFLTLHKLGELANNVREQQKEPIYQPLNPDVVVVEEAGQILEAHYLYTIPNLGVSDDATNYIYYFLVIYLASKLTETQARNKR